MKESDKASVHEETGREGKLGEIGVAGVGVKKWGKFGMVEGEEEREN